MAVQRLRQTVHAVSSLPQPLHGHAAVSHGKPCGRPTNSTPETLAPNPEPEVLVQLIAPPDPEVLVEEAACQSVTKPCQSVTKQYILFDEIHDQ